LGEYELKERMNTKEPRKDGITIIKTVDGNGRMV
jgi:hypothetical protein